MSNAFLFIFLGAIFDTIGDILMKSWVINSNKSYFFIGMTFYIVGLSFLAYSFHEKHGYCLSTLFSLEHPIINLSQ